MDTEYVCAISDSNNSISHSSLKYWVKVQGTYAKNLRDKRFNIKEENLYKLDSYTKHDSMITNL